MKCGGKTAVNCIKQKATVMGLIPGQEVQPPYHRTRIELAEATGKIFLFHPPFSHTENLRGIILEKSPMRSS